MTTFNPVEKPTESFPESSFEDDLKKEEEESLKPLFMVNVTVISASNVKNVDGILDKSDPYCEVFIGDSFYKTETVQNDLNPVWNKKMTFVLHDKPEKVDFKVSDENMINKNVYIGSASLDFNDMFESNEVIDEKELPIMEDNGDEAGKIKFSIKCRTLKPLETQIKLSYFEKALALKADYADAAIKALEQSEKLRQEAHEQLSAKDLELSKKSDELAECKKKYEAEFSSIKEELSKQAAIIEEKDKKLTDSLTKLEAAGKKAAEAESRIEKERSIVSAKLEELSKVEKEKKETLSKLESVTNLKNEVDRELIRKESSTVELGKELESVQKELQKTKSELESLQNQAVNKYCCGLF